MQEVILDKKAIIQAKKKMNFLFKLGKDVSFDTELKSILTNSKNLKTNMQALNCKKNNKNEKKINNIKLNTPIINNNLLFNSYKKQENKNSNILSNLLSSKEVKINKIQKLIDDSKELNKQLPNRLKIGKEELLQDVKEELFKENTNILLADISFTETLQFISVLKQNLKDVSLTEFSSFKDIIKQNKLNDFKECKNLNELCNLAKDNKLNIKNISYEIIKNQDYDENILNAKFPILAQQSFFNKINNISEKAKNTIQEKNKVANEKIQYEKDSINENKQGLKQGKLFELINEDKIKLNSKEYPKETKIQILNTQNNIQITQEQLKQNNELNTKIQNILKDNENNQNTQENENINLVLNNQESQNDENAIKNIENKSNILTNDNVAINNIKLDKEQIKTTINTFTQDFKDELNKFKAPIHKVDINLNPKELGEINVTMIARGNNLHVNLNSQNQNTLNLFIQNQQEFKNSMVNMGFTGINMNFGDKKEQEQQRQHNQNNRKNSTKDEEENTTTIEIILNRYL